MRNKLAVITLALGWMALAPAGAQTGSSFANLGTSWLKISPSTRNVGLGDSAAAVPDADDEAVLNPAALGVVGGTYLSLSQDFWAQNYSIQHLVFSQGNGGGGFSFGANFMNFGSIDTYSITGSTVSSTGNYSPIGLDVYAGLGFALSGGLRAGLTGHFIYDNVQQNFPDQTASVDLGMYYQAPGSPLSLSEVLSDLGWDIDESSLPLRIKTAAAYQLAPRVLTLSAEADWFLNGISYTQYGLGAEYWYKNVLALRAGYQFTNYGNLTGLVGLSLGAGISFSDWEVDYAFVSIGELGISNQIGLSLKLGDSPKPKSAPIPAMMATIAPTPAVVSTVMITPPPALAAAPVSLSFMDLYRSGIRNYQTKDYDAALGDLKKATTIYDKSVRRYYYAECFAMIGVIYKFNRPAPMLAHQYCDIALRIDPTTETAKKLRYEIDTSDTPTEKRYWKGMGYYEKKDYDEAIRLLRSVINTKDKTTPSFYYAEAYKALGLIYENNRVNKKKARECFKAALKIEPKDAATQQDLDLLSAHEYVK